MLPPHPNPSELEHTQDKVVCEFIGGPYDGLFKLIEDKGRYEHCKDNELRAYWTDKHYVSPGIHIEVHTPSLPFEETTPCDF